MLLVDRRNPLVTQGLLSTWLQCRTMARLTAYGWTPVGEKSYMTYGSLAHGILERVYRIWPAQKRGRPPQAKFVHAIVQGVSDAYRARNGKDWDAKVEQDYEFSVSALHAVMPRYFVHWGKEDFNDEVRWERLETVFRVPNGRFTLAGRLDGARVLRGATWLFETKTPGQINEENLGAVITRDFQLNFYLWALSKLARKVPAGALYNLVRRPGLARGKSGDPDEYEKRVGEHIDKDPTHYFKRITVPVDTKTLLWFQEELRHVLERFGEWLENGMPGEVFGMPCVSARGGLCKYVPLCFYGLKRVYFKRSIMYPELEDREDQADDQGGDPE